jgi:hypothetical protein
MMDKATLAMMNGEERALLRRVEPKVLKALDEDDLLDLHTRVRRARNKYSKLYRRRARAQVKADRSRGQASRAHTRTALKAEVFEDALAVVSRQLAEVARDTAEQLRAERLEAARVAKAGKSAPKATRAKASPKPSTGASKAKKKQRTPISKKSSASARAATRRSQAKKGSK